MDAGALHCVNYSLLTIIPLSQFRNLTIWSLPADVEAPAVGAVRAGALPHQEAGGGAPAHTALATPRHDGHGAHGAVRLRLLYPARAHHEERGRFFFTLVNSCNAVGPGRKL